MLAATVAQAYDRKILNQGHMTEVRAQEGVLLDL